MKHGVSRTTLSCAIASVCLVSAGSVRAQQPADNLVLEQVIVTATKQVQSLNDVGLSVVALSSREIDEMGFRNMDALVKSVPNVDVTQGLNGTRLTIRGVGSTSSGGVSPSVATFVDGVYLSSSRSSNAMLFDMERVEVLRGPQGALFGKNAIAGVFSLHTARPTREFEALIDLRAGNRDSHEATLMVSGPLSESVSARLAMYNRRTGDYLENDLGGPDAGGTDQEAYRLSLSWDISDSTSLWFKYEHNYGRLNSSLNQLIGIDPGDRSMLADVDGDWLSIIDGDMKLDGHMVSASETRYGYDLGIDSEKYDKNSRDFGALSLEHFFDNGYEVSMLIGVDSTDATAHGNASSSWPLSNIYLDTVTEFRSKSIELKLTSPQDERFRFTMGAYAEDSEEGIMDGYSHVGFDDLGPALNGVLAMAPPNGFGIPSTALYTDYAALTPALIMRVEPGDNTTDIRSLGAFFQASYDFNDEWLLIAGVRYSEDTLDQFFDPSNRADWNGHEFLSEASFLAAGVPVGMAPVYSMAGRAFFSSFISLPGEPVYKEEHTDRAVLPSARLEFRPDFETLYYLSAQSGYKNGGFNTFSLSNPTPFDKETSLAFELGAKYSLADGRGQLNMAIFHTGFDDLQVGYIDPVSGGVGFSNAAEATSQGIELDITWRLTQALTFGAQYGYLEAEYDKYRNATCNIDQQIAVQDTQPAPLCVQDLSGEPLTNAPSHSASITLDYTQPIWGSLEFQSNLIVSYRDEYFVEATNSRQFEAPDATLVDLRLAIASPAQAWTVALIGRNLSDDDGMIYGSGSGAGMRKGTYFGQMRQPRSYWLQLEKRFY